MIHQKKRLSPFQIIQLILKEPLVFFGGIFTLIGFFFLIVMHKGTSVDDFYFLCSDKQTTQGSILDVTKTNASENEIPVFEYEFSYQVENEKYLRVAYNRGQTYSRSSDVIVEFVPSNPSLATIRGMRTTTFGLWSILFTGIFPVIGIGVLGNALRSVLKKINIINNGKLEVGCLESAIPTGTKVNNRRLYKMVFSYKVDGKTYRSSNKTLRHEVLMDEAEEYLIYHQSNPHKMVLLDLLPESVKKMFVDRAPYMI